MSISKDTLGQIEQEGLVYSLPDFKSLKNVAAVILAGGSGTRLFPLTQNRCKPAITFGGSFKLIDIPMSNALNSGCNKIYIISQYLSASLHQHILRTYRIDSFQQGFIELLAPEQKPAKNAWYQGTADAVRQNIEYLMEAPVDYFLILSGDQLYHIDFNMMLASAKKSNADFTVAALPVIESQAQRMGILKIDEDGFVTNFLEKPQASSDLSSFQWGFPTETTVDMNKLYLGSMGIYMVKREVLVELLREDPREDFGKHLIPTQIKRGTIATYIHKGYWEDIGTIDSFYQANMNLTLPNPPFDIYNENHPIYRSNQTLHGAKLFNTQIKHSIISEGALIDAKEIRHSIIGPKTIINKGTVIDRSYIIGNDSYSSLRSKDSLSQRLAIGSHCVIQKTIIDKNAHIGNNVRLTNDKGFAHYDSEGVYIRDGIIVVSQGAVIPDGYTL